MNATKKSRAGFLALIGGSAAITAAAVFLGVAQGAPAADTASTEMSTGATLTEKPHTPSAPEVPEAVPSIKGPAPLPPEEQGLPG